MKYLDNDLQHLLSQFGQIINTNISLYNIDYNYITGYTSHLKSKIPQQTYTDSFSKENSDFTLCRYIKDNGMMNCCRESDAKCFNMMSKDSTSSILYNCWFGFKEIAVKLSYQNICHSYVLIGPFRSHENDEILIKNIEKLVAEHPADKEKLYKTFSSIPTIDEKKYQAIVNLCTVISDYSIYNHIINMDTTTFSKKISPYIKEHLDTPLTIDQLCHHFYLSKKQLNTLFIKSVNVSPKKYINNQKILKAKELLLSTDKPIKTIATEVGIPDYNYFTKVFKSFDGHTPSFYRQKSNGEV